MKEKAIIYCRKSTDRDDLQTNSLEHQEKNCRRTLETKGLELYDIISESVSAKIEYKRVGFNRMVDICKKGKVDYIIIDEPKRLSRNNIDTSRIVDLMDKNQIKGIFATGRQYLAVESRDKFLLQLDLSISKMDNEDRSKDVRNKMITAMNKGKWMGKAIFGYRNVGRKGKKDVVVVEEEAVLVRQAFLMRSKNESLQKIADYINEKMGTEWTGERISKMITNTKYYGLQKFGKQEAYLDSPGYKPIVSKELFDKANKITRVAVLDKNPEVPRYFNNIIKDTDGNNLYPYITKGHIYYHGGAKTKYKINVSQNSIFKEFEKYIENYNFPKPFISLTKATLKEYYKDKVNSRETDIRKATKELETVKKRLDSLLDYYLDENIDNETYTNKKQDLENKREELEEKLKALNQGDDNIKTIIENLCELVENLSETYKSGNDEKKGKIIKAMQCELIINNKKELTIKESKLFEIIKNSNSQVWYSKDRGMQTIKNLFEYINKNLNYTERLVNGLIEVAL